MALTGFWYELKISDSDTARQRKIFIFFIKLSATGLTTSAQSCPAASKFFLKKNSKAVGRTYGQKKNWLAANVEHPAIQALAVIYYFIKIMLIAIGCIHNLTM